jgi:thymidylate synthase (FAD)
VKQGSADMHHSSIAWRDSYIEHCEISIALYEEMIADNVCPEQARFVLPQGCEVNWVWTGSLYAYANFYNQRSDSHAQKEIQELADQVDKIIAPLFPVSWSALTKGDY